MTLSMTIFKGHGAARVISICTSIAARITASVPRRGRSSSRSSGGMRCAFGHGLRDYLASVQTCSLARTRLAVVEAARAGGYHAKPPGIAWGSVCRDGPRRSVVAEISALLRVGVRDVVPLA